MGSQSILGVHLRLLRMLLVLPGKSEMVFGRAFPKYRTAFTFRKAESNRVEQPFPRCAVECCCKFDQITDIKVIFTIRYLVNSLQ